MLQCEYVAREQLWDNLAAGAVVITSSVRYANILRDDYEQAHYGQGVIESPAIVVYRHWVNEIWEELLVADRVSPLAVLSAEQQLLLWEALIAESDMGKDLLQREGAAKLARKAWLSVQQWALDINDPAFRYNEDSRAFYGWCQTFDTRCQALSAIAEEALPDQITHFFSSADYPFEKTILLTGFDELTPQLQALMQSLCQAGAQVRWVTLQKIESSLVRLAAEDARQEASFVARWLKGRLDKNPAQRIAVVVQDLSSERYRLLRVLDEFLAPETLQPGAVAEIPVYNLSLGLPLNEYPVIHIALKALLLLNKGASSIHDIACLLHSPFLAGWEQEQHARALLYARLRDRGELQLNLTTLVFYAEQQGKTHYCPVLVRCLQRLMLSKQSLPARDYLCHWSECFIKVLSDIGWSLGRTLSSAEFQTVAAWKELLARLGGLDVSNKKQTSDRALSWLTRMSRGRIFQPQTGDAPVQVLGILEAAHLAFDAVWIMGMHDEAWPPACRPDAFIPLALQREYRLPHSSPDRVLDMAKKNIQAIVQSVPEVIVSYPLHEGDKSFSCSPLFDGLTPITENDLELSSMSTWSERIHQSACLETMVDEQGPVIDDASIRGGSGIFKDQALCPFRAFANRRLHTRVLGEVGSVLPASNRGNIVHRSLELFWQTVTSLERLNSLTSDALNERIGACIDQALTEEAVLLPRILSERFQQLEKIRLLRLLLAWLELEQGRSDFNVLANEQQFNVRVAGIEVNLKVDRVDQLADGGLVVIDYKTGKVEARQWFGERPEEPQLPLYSMVVEGDIRGVSFALVSLDQLCFRGAMEGDDILPGVKAYDDDKNKFPEYGSWDELLADWQQQIESLAQAFCAGMAAVDPKDGIKSCQYCGLELLCRVGE
ncbi:MAG: hypothetical protein GXP22_03580 [Gammaproteobacteria bacterium]|nr:hypothetical protein [Gammaproteobacteria bacterium]